jgi:acyl carrier protein
MDKARLVDIVVAAVRDYSAAAGGRPASDISASTVLFGPRGALDSIGLVSVLVAVEQELNEKHGMPVSLMDDRAMSRERSPFRTPETLADYVLSLGVEGARP